MSDTWWHDFLWKSYYIRSVYTHTDFFSWIRFLRGKYFVSVSVVIVCMLTRDNVWSLCTPKHGVCQMPSWQALSWADILTSIWYALKIHFLFGKGVRVTTGFTVPSAPPDTLLLEVCCDRRFEKHCAKRQLSSLLKCYLSLVWMGFLFHFFAI